MFAKFISFPSDHEQNKGIIMEQIEQPQQSAPQTTSLMDRITNVFASPSELFDEVAVTKVQTSSWLVPLILSILMALSIIVALYYNDSLRSQIYDKQAEKMHQAVEQGKMTQEQVDQYVDGMRNSGPVMFIAIGGVSAVIMTAIIFFVATLIFWLVTKFGLKFSGPYTKMLEVFGLSSMIGFLGSIVAIIMMYVFDSMTATPSGSIFIYQDFDVNNKIHLLLAQLNIFTIWQMGILGIGISKISNKSLGAGLGVAYGLWILWVLASTMFGLGMR